jgi:hypothetical protein
LHGKPTDPVFKHLEILFLDLVICGSGSSESL